MITRTCPKCSAVLTYKNKYSCNRAERLESVCSRCIQASRRRRVKTICETCNILLQVQPNQLKKRNYCSRECADKGHSKYLTKKEYKEVECPECNTRFMQHWKGPKKYCSAKCNSRANLKTVNSKAPKNKGTIPEMLLMGLLDTLNINYQYQRAVPWKRGWKKWYDFYLPDYNLLVEVDGIYWHGKDIPTSALNKQQWNTRKNDRLKNYLAKLRGFNLVRIWSNEIEHLNLLNIIQQYE